MIYVNLIQSKLRKKIQEQKISEITNYYYYAYANDKLVSIGVASIGPRGTHERTVKNNFF